MCWLNDEVIFEMRIVQKISLSWSHVTPLFIFDFSNVRVYGNNIYCYVIGNEGPLNIPISYIVKNIW